MNTRIENANPPSHHINHKYHIRNDNLHNGVDITYISKRVGHSNTAITIQVYSHMLKEKEQVQNELALNILDNLGKNT